MTRIAFIPLTPLGDSILLMGELEELKRLYSPCDITVFAIPLIAELFRNFEPCDRVVELNGGIHGPVALPAGFDETFDIVFNHGYEPWYDDIVRKLKRPGGKAYGMEETYRPAAECEKLFDKWVSFDHWKNVTLKRWPLVPNQFAELIRLVNPDYAGGPPSLSCENFRCEPPDFGTVCVVGNDTGLMHLACALGAPSVTIMPFGSQFTWFPYGKDGRTRHICLAPSCSHVMCASRCGELLACVQKVAVENAIQAVARLVGIDFSTMDFPVDSRQPPGSEHV